MNCTEEEAKKKWCPMARLAFTNCGINRQDDDTPISECITSKCMMWVFNSDRRYGHCGLAYK